MSSQSLYQYPIKPASWNERDLLIFAASIGCDAEDLQYGYELDPNFAAFPTYSIVLTFKHDYTNTTSFAEHFTKFLTPPKDLLPGFPALDIQRVVDGERTLEVVRSLPKSSAGRDFAIQSNVTGIWDKGTGKPTIVKTTHDLIERFSDDKDAILYTRMSETAIFMSQGGWNGPNGPKPQTAPSPPKDRSPDASNTHHISPTAHLLYRLNGDYNPLHATRVQEAVVQPTPIMHGLYSWNAVARIVLKKFAKGDAQALKTFRASFASPVRPGDILETDMWISRQNATRKEIRFETKVKGKVVLANGVVVLETNDKGSESKL
ncbi:Putative maoC-like dehydratase domain, HotDog domain superfamily [Septoria linicola]|uniref:MaoC-like dehydratase domain, HotDog domain superfamily n=1 Tax=Septoria linicola TaxID=215465 RepID=A0A9Q9EQX5_9PEZI|nr:putative maoC-like dehydratase domain, HotDog domain superfamily [Septoria linicola]USW59279.1 Putative maoC-like dehydratase domain, HotDog domain superfamily [Septoria linicola]